MEAVDPEHRNRPRRRGMAEVPRLMPVSGLLSAALDALALGFVPQLLALLASKRGFQAHRARGGEGGGA